MDVHHKIGHHHMMSAQHFKSESESRFNNIQETIFILKFTTLQWSSKWASLFLWWKWRVTSPRSLCSRRLASCPGQPAARCARGNLAPTRRTEMVATNNSMEFVWRNPIFYVSSRIFWKSQEDPYRHHFCTVSYGMGNAMIILYQGFGVLLRDILLRKNWCSFFQPPPPHLDKIKYCQRHNGPEGWVHITESRLSINFSAKHQHLQ